MPFPISAPMVTPSRFRRSRRRRCSDPAWRPARQTSLRRQAQSAARIGHVVFRFIRPCALPRQNRNKRSSRQVVRLAGLDESRGTLFASRRLSLPDLRGAFRPNECSPASSPAARGQPHPTQSMPNEPWPDRPLLRQNFVPECPSGVTFAVINRLKALRATRARATAP